MKTRIYQSDLNTVIVETNDEDGLTRTAYFVPRNGGYVRIRTESGDNPQVCKGLSGFGSTLECSDPNNLLSLIRREYRRGRDAERRDEARARRW